MKNLFLLSLLGFILTISSCAPQFDIEDDPTLNPNEEEVTTMENLVVSNDFNWKTYNDVNLTLEGNSSAIVKVVSSDGILYQQAYLTSDKSYEMKLAIPAHVTSVRLQYNDQDIPIDISSKAVNYSFTNN